MTQLVTYVKITLEKFGTYIQPLDKLDVLVAEIQEAASCENFDSSWRVSFTRMTEDEYNDLPEFEGY